MPKSIKTKKRLIDFRHPFWSMMRSDWIEWRLAYEGGSSFIDAYLQRYSRRETRTDFNYRRVLSYNPGHTTTCLNMFRDALMAKAHDIKRTGDAIYQDMCSKNVDLNNNSMNAFIGLEVIPWLMAQGRRFIVIDSPDKPEGATRDEDTGRPYMWSVNAEDVVEWKYGADGKLNQILIEETTEICDEEFDLPIDTVLQYRYMKLLDEGEVVRAGDYEITGDAKKKQVLLRILDKAGKDDGEPKIIDIPRIPVVEIKLVDSLLKNVAPIQRGLLNLNSTDMNFLFRGNFPLYTQQVDPTKRSIAPRATKKSTRSMDKVDMEDREAEVEGDQRNVEKKEVGINTGVTYPIGATAPSFIGPPVTNTQLSMAKQDEMKREIRTLLDLSLVSMAAKAMEQSGVSKKEDRVGINTGLAYIGSVCESAEREAAEIIHLFLASNVKPKVKYPTEYSMKTDQERLGETETLETVKSSCRSETFQKKVEKRQARTLLGNSCDETELQTIEKEIDAAVWFDANLDRSTIITTDLANKVVSAETASLIRGYKPDEMMKVDDEQTALVESLSGGPVIPPDPNNPDPNAEPDPSVSPGEKKPNPFEKKPANPFAKKE